MVAFVIGKFTDASAHTSYLCIVKKPVPSERAVAIRLSHLFDGNDREPFAPFSAIRARKTSQLELNPFTPLWRIRNFDCSAPFRAGRPLYIDFKFPVNAWWKISCEILRLEGASDHRNVTRRARIIGPQDRASTPKTN